jgi:PTS system nitrogen regulatory IIA component
VPYRNLSLDDFAKYIGMDVREVRKMADRGKLPGQKVGGEWRFNRARVTEWLQEQMPSLDAPRLIALERSMGDVAVDSPDTAKVVTNKIGIEGIDIELAANTRTSILRELVKLAERTGILYDPDGLLEAIQQREEMCSTALPNGVAIPHPRQPMPYVSAEPLICVARTTRGIGFGSQDRDLTSLFFLICCHEDRDHLRTLARLMRILAGETVGELMTVESPEECLEILIRREKAVIEANS